MTPYLMSLLVRCGEYEFYCRSIIKCENEEEALETAEYHAKTWYGDDTASLESGEWLQNCDEVAVSVYQVTEIKDKNVLDSLKQLGFNEVYK